MTHELPTELLDGATEPGPPNVEATPEQFAARWNAQTPEARAEWLEGRRADSRAAMRCWAEQHDHRIETSVPLSVEDRELIASALYSLARQTDTPTSGYMRALALAARIAPDQSSLVSRVQAGGHA